MSNNENFQRLFKISKNNFKVQGWKFSKKDYTVRLKKYRKVVEKCLGSMSVKLAEYVYSL